MWTSLIIAQKVLHHFIYKVVLYIRVPVGLSRGKRDYLVREGDDNICARRHTWQFQLYRYGPSTVPVKSLGADGNNQKW